MRKSSLLTFLFAIVPGAGQMYLGLMKRGLSLMTLFFGCIATIAFIHLEPLALLLPVIWFYAFFDAFNMRYLTPEQLREADHYLYNTALLPDGLKNLFSKGHKLAGGICIGLGVYILWDNFSYFLYSIFERYEYVYRFIRNIPTMVLAAVIIMIGLNLMRGKKPISAKLLDQKYDFKEYGGANEKDV